MCPALGALKSEHISINNSYIAVSTTDKSWITTKPKVIREINIKDTNIPTGINKPFSIKESLLGYNLPSKVNKNTEEDNHQARPELQASVTIEKLLFITTFATSMSVGVT